MIDKVKKSTAINDTPSQTYTECHLPSCYMVTLSITYHPTQVNTARLNSSPMPVLDLPTPEG